MLACTPCCSCATRYRRGAPGCDDAPARKPKLKGKPKAKAKGAKAKAKAKGVKAKAKSPRKAKAKAKGARVVDAKRKGKRGGGGSRAAVAPRGDEEPAAPLRARRVVDQPRLWCGGARASEGSQAPARRRGACLVCAPARAGPTA